MLPAEFICPKCKTNLTLEKQEQTEQKFICPNCGCFIDCTFEPPKISDPTNGLVPIYRPYNQQEISMIKTVLDGAKICYFIRNEITTLGSLSPTIDAFTELYVEKSRVQESIELLEIYLDKTLH